MREEHDAFLRPCLGQEGLRQLPGNGNPVSDAQISRSHPALSAAQAMIPGDANGTPTCQPNLDDFTLSDAPDGIGCCMDDASIWGEGEQARCCADEAPN